jgi:sec-independent protein translocase protein TatA
MIGDLFDSPWKILIVAVVIIVLFGSAKLPAAARSLGKSMRILKTEVAGLHKDEDESDLATAPAELRAPVAPVAPVMPAAPAAAAVDHQAQIDALAKQLAELQRSAQATDSAQAK